MDLFCRMEQHSKTTNPWITTGDRVPCCATRAGNGVPSGRWILRQRAGMQRRR